MSDWIHNLLGTLDHNRYLAISILGVVLCAGLLFGTQGCQSTTAPVIGTDPVTRVEFDIQAAQVKATLNAKKAATVQEIEAFNERVAAGYADLDAKDAIRQDIVDTVSLVATQAGEGTLNPLSLIPIGVGLLGGLLGIGAGLDNRRKDAVIADQKASLAKATT